MSELDEHDINLFDFLEMLSTNEASILAVNEINYETVYSEENLPGIEGPSHKITIKNVVDGQDVSGEATSASVSNALAGAINNYIKNILQDLVGYGVRENPEESFEKEITKEEETVEA